jgi:hypothetical protein
MRSCLDDKPSQAKVPTWLYKFVWANFHKHNLRKARSIFIAFSIEVTENTLLGLTSRDISVDITSGSTTTILFPTWEKDFSLLHNVQTNSGIEFWSRHSSGG